jgi:glycosyltransferase involved in cell wall biosynthesis
MTKPTRLPAVSVVIPCYGQAHYLPDSIGSVVGQTHEAHEIIVVDDGSPDDVTSAAARFTGVRVIRQQNQGLATARNRGLLECSGELVVFLDADDRLLPNALEAGARALSSRPECAFAWGFNRAIDPAGRPMRRAPTQFHGTPSYAALLERNIVGAPVGVMFRRDAVQAAGGFSPDVPMAEDYEMYLRLARSHPLHCHGQLIAEYRRHGSNMSHDHATMLESVLHILDAQAPFTEGDRGLRRALRRGRRDARIRYHATREVERLTAWYREGRRARATTALLGLIMRYPAFGTGTVLRWLRS